MKFKKRFEGCLALSALAVTIILTAVFTAAIRPALVFAGNDGTLSASEIEGGTFLPGESFDVTVRIDGNTGFAGMSIYLYIPEGLILTHVYLEAAGLLEGVIPRPEGWDPLTGEISPITGSADFFFIMARTSDFKPVNTPLFTFTFEAAQDAHTGPTDTIKFALAVSGADGIINPSIPVDYNGRPLNITIADDGIIGSVVIGPVVPPRRFCIPIRN